MAKDLVPVLHGYYRYTDIQFEWGKVLENESEVQSLKAFLSMHAMASPEHPFWEGQDKGTVLYIGTLPHGQSRLLLSSKQAEYARYWVHAMGLSKNLLPLPSSESLITRETLRHVSEMHCKTAEEIKNAVKMVDKANRALRGADSSLAYCRQLFEKVRGLYSSNEGTWLAIDIEAWELDHTMITEFGWSSLTWSGKDEVEKMGHMIVKENFSYTNHQHVQGARDYYAFGTSETLRRREMNGNIRRMISEAQSKGPLFLVFHDSSQDVKYLRNQGGNFERYFGDLPLEDLAYILPADTPSKGTFVIDTQELFAGLEGESMNKRGLAQMCRLLKIETEHLHNAGNDAHYTMLALKSMASGNQIDHQREERWPQQTQGTSELGSTFKVKHNPYDEDSDFSELEGATSRLVHTGPDFYKASEEANDDYRSL